jgi:DNA glycosylase AlkZ-like
VARAVDRIGAIQAQDVTAPYGALHARLEGFRREALDRALERRLVVKATLMRGTLHLVSARDYAPFVAALLPSLRTQYAGVRLRGAPSEEIDALAQRALAFGSEPRTNTEFADHLGGLDEWFRARFHAPFVVVPPFERRPRMIAASEWLELDPVSEEEARAHLVSRYLAAFGPATVKDAARWARLPQSAVRAGLERVRTIDLGDGYLDLPRSPRPGEVAAPPRLLPLFDLLLLGHDDRTRVVPLEYAKAINQDGGVILRSFLVDGLVAGLWRTDGGALILSPFAPLPRVARRELEDEARRTAAFVGAARVRFA